MPMMELSRAADVFAIVDGVGAPWRYVRRFGTIERRVAKTTLEVHAMVCFDDNVVGHDVIFGV